MPLNRRSFLVSGVAAARPLGAVPPRIRIGFLGGAHSHAMGKAEVVRQSPHWDLAGVWEPDPAVRPQYQKAGIPLVDRERLLEDASIPVIAVESAVKDHAEHARWALEAGKHIHLEKPPAARYEEFRRLVELARSKRVLMQMGYMWRYNPATRMALERARSGQLGDVVYVRGTMNTYFPAERRPEFAIFHGGNMFEQGAHLVDLVVRLLGKPARVTPFLRKHGRYNDPLADNTLAVFEYPRALAVITACCLQQNAMPHRTFEIIGARATAVVRPIEPPALAIDNKPVETPPYRRYVDDFEELAQCVRSNRPLSITPETDLAVQETLMRASEM